MKPQISVMFATIAGFSLCALAQQPGPNEPAPIFHVTVVERTTKAINYQYRSGPTIIDFRGTILMSKLKGDAIVESKQGRTDIDAHVDNLISPQGFGREYLTYVLWALTPDGRPHNLGELVPGSSDKAKLHVTTDLQAFALIVTAEPYSAVRHPSDVVVAENVVRPDTVGKIEEVNAKYELLPRGHYAWNTPNEPPPAGPSVSTRRYEELSELYQAQNAIGIARAAEADRYAPNTFAKAEQLLNEAQQLDHNKGDRSRVIQAAREASQTAEDAKVISDQRRRDDQMAKIQADANAAQLARAQAEAEVQQAKMRADAAQAQAEAERAARERAEHEAEIARQSAAQTRAQARVEVSQIQAQANRDNAAVAIQQQQERAAGAKTELRMRMLEQINGAMEVRDTPRGLVVTVPSSDFSSTQLLSSSTDRVARVAGIIASHPGLRVEVEGHTDSGSSESLSWRRAEAVRNVLLARGLSASSVTSRGLGSSRPIASNATVQGREQNQRVEIVVSGDPIGSLPIWDRTYSLSRR